MITVSRMKRKDRDGHWQGERKPRLKRHATRESDCSGLGRDPTDSRRPRKEATASISPAPPPPRLLCIGLYKNTRLRTSSHTSSSLASLLALSTAATTGHHHNFLLPGSLFSYSGHRSKEPCVAARSSPSTSRSARPAAASVASAPPTCGRRTSTSL